MLLTMKDKQRIEVVQALMDDDTSNTSLMKRSTPLLDHLIDRSSVSATLDGRHTKMWMGRTHQYRER
jgi:hypothetical protein